MLLKYSLQFICRVVRAGRRSTIGNRVNRQSGFEGSNPLPCAKKRTQQKSWVLLNNAPVVKLADTLDSDSSRVFSVQVQVLSGAPKKRSTKCASLFVFLNYLCTRPEPSPPANFSTSETETLL